MMSLFSGPIARNTVLTTAVLLARLLAVAVHMLLAARLLGPEGFSHYVVIGALAVFAGAFSIFGTHLLVMRAVARGADGDMLAAALGTWRVLSVPLFMVYLWVCHVLGVLSISPWLVFSLGLAEFFIQPVLQLLTTVCQGRGQVAVGQCWLAAPVVLRGTLLWPAAMLLALPAESVVGLVHLATVAICVVFILVSGRVRLPAWRCWYLLPSRHWAEAGGFAILGVTAGGQAELDKVLSLRLLGAGPAGLYAAASRAISASILPVVALLVSALPRLFGRAGWEPGLLRLLAMLAACYACLAAGGLWLLAPWLERALGEQYAGAADVVRILVWAVPAQALRMVAVNALMAKGAAWLRGGLEVAGMVVLVVMAVAFATQAAAEQLAWAVVASEWLVLLVLIMPAAVYLGRAPGR